MTLKGFNPETDEPDPVRWFDDMGACRECRKQATGKLMGPRNESYGAFCRRCAEKRLDRARSERNLSEIYRRNLTA